MHSRAKNANGNWGLTNTFLFYKPYTQSVPPPPSANPQLDILEYYFDTDPGYGNGLRITLPATKDTNNLNVPLDITSLGIGSHTAYLRLMDANGKWSMMNNWQFLVDTVSGGAVTVGTVAGTVCAGNTLRIPFTANATLDSNNVFIAELSNQAGSFSSPINIGTLRSNHSDTINATIPINAVGGTGHRVRVKASSPLIISSDNGSNITINPVVVPVVTISPADTIICNGSSITLAATSSSKSIIWSTGQTTNSINVSPSATTTYTITADSTTSNGCRATTQKTVKVTVLQGAPAIAPVISRSGRNLYASTPPDSAGVTKYNWYADSTLIPGVMGSYYYAASDATYTVRFVNPCGTGPSSKGVAVSTKQDQTITFDAISDKTFGDAPFVVRATASSGRPIIYSIYNGPATISNDTVSITGAGFVTVRATQPGDSTYSIAFSDRTFTVNKAAASISLNNLTKVYNRIASNPGTETNPPSLPVTFTYDGSAVTPSNAGSYTVIATISSPNYSGSASGTFVIQKANQGVSIIPVPDQSYTGQTINVTASATSGLPVSLTVSSTPAGIATLNGNIISINGAGTVKIDAAQNGNINYNQSDPVADTFVIIKGSQTITQANIPDQVIGDTLVLHSSASSGLPVTYSISTAPLAGVATLSGDTVFMTADTGRVNITISQAGNDNYNSTQTQRLFRVLGKPQIITFSPLSPKTFGDPPFGLSATASSGLPVSFRIVSGPATLNRDTVILTDDGTVVIEAIQAGNSKFTAAPAVRQSFTVTRRYPDLIVQNVTSGNADAAPNDTIAVSWNVSNIGEIASAVDWTERIFMQSANGQNRTLLKQSTFRNTDTLAIGQNILRNEKVIIPTQLNIGDQGVFVVEVVPGSAIREASGSQANNTGVQQSTWAIRKLLFLQLSSDQITEGSGGISVSISRTGSVANQLPVSITLSSTSKFSYPSIVNIPSGQAGTTFTVSAPDNTTIEGTVTDSSCFCNKFSTGTTKTVAN